jgi:hypothetical protein
MTSTHNGLRRWPLAAMFSAVLLVAAGCTGTSGTDRAAAAGNTAPAVAASPSASTVSSAPSATPGGAATSGGVADAPCAYKLINTDLPTWARAGFNGPPFNTVPHVTSSRGDIVAVLFGSMLAPPPSATEGQNKVLWVPKDPSAGALTVDAHLVGTSENADIGDISFGPPYVDVPKPGCWRLTLHWIGPTETVDIVYGAR